MVRLVNKHSGVVVVVDETVAANLSSEWTAPKPETKPARKTTAEK